MTTDLTEAQVISKLSELHNDITCQIDLNPPADVVSPYQLKLHKEQLADTLASYKSFILHWNIIISNHSEIIGVKGVQGWRQWKSTLDTKFRTFKMDSNNKPRRSTWSQSYNAIQPITKMATSYQQPWTPGASQPYQPYSSPFPPHKQQGRRPMPIDHTMLELCDLTAQYQAQ